MDKSLTLSNGETIGWFPKKYTNYLNKTIVVYGKRGSGKSFIVDEIMYLCRDHIPFLYVIAKSVTANNPYKGKVPVNCIKSSASKEWMEDFLKFQQNRAEMYNIANTIDILRSTFQKIRDSRSVLIEKKIIADANAYKQKIQLNPNYNFGKKKEDMHKVDQIMKTSLIELYKNHIRFSKAKLLEMVKQRKLTREETCAVQYLDFKPHVLLVFDDCASKLKEWCTKSTTIKELFYEGRHYYITFIITTQSDKELASEFRQNADLRVFTTDQSAISSFGRASDAYPKQTRDLAEICVERIFRSETKHGKNYKKLIYFDDTFYYTIADEHTDFKMGCSALWNIDQKIQMKKNERNGTSEFFEKYYNF